MSNDWKFFKEVNFDDTEINQFHVDTRDFCVSMYSEKDTAKNLSDIKKYPDKFFHTAKEVAELLNRYYYQLGGDSKKRYFMLTLSDSGLPYSEGWQMKYIRIYRTEHGLLVCNRDSYALKKEILANKIKKPY